MVSKNQRWLVDSGILRKKNMEEEPQELLVFGYSCKLFRDDERAKMIDQGKHLIPWMGDNTLKIDRYDGRGALGDLTMYEPPSGGFDQRTILTEEELKIEQLCDEERYHSLYNNEVEESMYHEEEMKRFHQALDSENTYGQVAYNYEDQDSRGLTGDDSQSPKPSEGSHEEEDQVFILPPELEVPDGMVLPETQKLHAIIAKTALFISRQGSQMEILIKAKQANNSRFQFLSMDSTLHPYYKIVLEAIKTGKYNPEKPPEKEESASEESDNDGDGYLHPSLASSLTKVEAAPSIPSIQYKPSADCAYSMLVNKITGKPPVPKLPTLPLPPPLPLPEVQLQPIPPPGYFHPIPGQGYATQYPTAPQQYSHGPVIYGSNEDIQPASSHGIPVPSVPFSEVPPVGTVMRETPVPLVPYGITPTKPLSRPSFIVPPADIQIIIDKMASYVAKNGRDFESIVKAKGDPRFNFLELSHQYHGYYAHKLTIHEGAVNPKVLTEEELLRKQESQEEKQKRLEELKKKQQRMEEVQKRVKMIQAKKKEEKQITTVSFSIKKPKEGEALNIEKRSALPMEESDDDGDELTKEQNDEEYPKPTTPEPPLVSSTIREEQRELVDLTDDILEDCQNQIRTKQAENSMDEQFDKITSGTTTIKTSRDRQLQLERKRKAAMFLSQIQLSKFVVKPIIDQKADQDSDEVHSIPSPMPEDVTNSRSNNSLMDRLRSADLGVRSSTVRSRSRSRSKSNLQSSKHRNHKKHKRKKSSHKSYDSPSSSRSHNAKRSKKSSSRHRTRSRSPSRRYRQNKSRSVSSASNSSSS